MPWLKNHDPAIHFGRRELLFDSPFCQRNCSRYGKTIPLYTSSRELGEEETDKRDQARKVLPARNLSEVFRTQIQGESPSLGATDQVTPDTSSHRDARQHQYTPKAPGQKKPVFPKPPLVSIVGAHAFAYLYNQPGVQLFTMSFSDLIPESIEMSSTEIQEADLSLVPEEYRDLIDLFAQREADKLPPHRPYDHQIPLEPGTMPPFGTIYSMSLIELEALRKYIKENLRKGFICHSQSLCSSFILLLRS